MTNKSIKIGRHVIGSDNPCFVIAEAGVNHNGDGQLAHQLIDAAADAGADAIKFQTYRTEDIVTNDAPKAEYQKRTTANEESQWEMLVKLELNLEIYPELKTHATERGLIFMSTPFDYFSVDFLDNLGVPAFKVPSGEITHVGLLRHIAAKGKPIIMSTGMSTLVEVEEAIGQLRSAGAGDICLLHCTSNYPTSPEDVNLRAMNTLRDVCQVPVGLSDHTQGFEVALAAVALGASVIEKHLTLDHQLEGPDHLASMEPAEFAAMVKSLRNIEAAMGSPVKAPCASESGVAQVARRSLVAAKDLPKGTILCITDIVIKRPGTGLPPASLPTLVGKTLFRPLSKGQLFSAEDIG